MGLHFLILPFDVWVDNCQPCLAPWDKLLTRKNQQNNYCISQTIRRTFFPEKCDLKSTCVLYAEGKYLFPNL